MPNPFFEEIKADSFSKNNKLIGNLGEDIAEYFLKRKGFDILNRNYLKKWGEIDVIARKDKLIHFVEVKTISYQSIDGLKLAVTRGTYRPEEKVDEFKLKKISRAINSWILENNFQGDWQIDVMAVRVVTREKYALVKFLDNIIL